MSTIKLLDTNTINQIAAGEVIDRPASILKELVENSIDAGADTVSIEIKGGGIDLIRITDNGIGIPAEEVPIAFLRHATSKINTASDLPLVTSLGFRGEALASIAAVADVHLITKQRDAIIGTDYHISGGVEISNTETGAPDGTTFIISDVFGNVPVRKKFLKTAATEGAYCTETIERIALSHPEVSFKFKNNGRDYFFTNGNSKLKEMIFGIYGREIANEMIEVEGDEHGIHIYGVIARPTVARSNRNTENFFVNGRYIKSAIISKGIENAYQPFLMQHKYPFTCIYIDIDPLLMDVNVHPSKQEVRFENPEAVYMAVYNACSKALKEKSHIHRFESENVSKKGQTPVESIKVQVKQESKPVHSDINVVKEVIPALENIKTKTADIDSNKTNAPQKTLFDLVKKGAERTIAESKDTKVSFVTDGSTVTDGSVVNNSSAIYDASAVNDASEINNASAVNDASEINNASVINDCSLENKNGSSEIEINKSQGIEVKSKYNDNTNEIKLAGSEHKKIEDKNSISKVIPEPFENKRMEQLTFDLKIENDEGEHIETAKEFKTVFSEGYRIVGQVFNTYWIVECQGCMYMIDQHAAHEKIIYEKMMSNLEISSESQLISPPMIVTLSSAEAAAAEQYAVELEKCGFSIENFGGKEYALTAIPLNLYGLDAKSLLFDILTELSTLPTNSVLTSIKEKIATCSCKAAVKGNMELSEMEAKALLKQLLEAENPFNCPHGRPIIIDYSKYEIEKKFKRIL